MRRSQSNFNLNVVPQKPESAPDTASETKKMTGFADIAQVAASAPATPTGGDIASPRSTSSTASPRAKRQTEAQKKEEEKNARVEEALSKVGTSMMKELAVLPYEAWAVFFSDPALRLTEEEAKTLADTYYTIAKALKPEQLTSWKVLLALAVLQNFRLVIVKLRLHSENVEKAKAAARGQLDSTELADKQITIV